MLAISNYTNLYIHYLLKILIFFTTYLQLIMVKKTYPNRDKTHIDYYSKWLASHKLNLKIIEENKKLQEQNKHLNKILTKLDNIIL